MKEQLVPLIFLKTSSNIPGLRDRSVVGFIHRVLGKEGAGDCSSPLGGLLRSMKDVSPDALAIMRVCVLLLS